MGKQIRSIIVRDEIAYVPLTMGLVAIVDASDLRLVEGHNWSARKDWYSFYAVRFSPRTSAGRLTINMHRAIMSAPPGALVDHKNGDGLDNRRANLRFASASQNNSNSRIRASNSTGFKGVTFDRGRQKWRAQISVGGRVINLGRYETPEDAHAAYAQSAQKHYGEFARLA